MLLITGFLLLLGQTDLLMIGLMSDPEQVGLYKVATKTASFVLFPLFAVNAVTAPRFAEMYANGDNSPLQRLASTAAHWIFWSSLTVSATLITSSGFLLGLFGASFYRAEPALWILVAGQLANTGAGAVGPLLLMTGYQQESAKVYGACALLNIILNAIGIYFMGILGAAIATAVSTALWNGGLYWLVTTKLGVYPSVFDSFRSSASP
jgi:O-antigen/teichoic acid export membrane protein